MSYIDYIKVKVADMEDAFLIEEAYNFANEKLLGLCYANDDILINHILEVTSILVDFNADSLTLISSIVYLSINNGISKEEIENRFGSDIANISFCAAKLNKQELISVDCNGNSCLDDLCATSPLDVRSLFIKLADRFYHMKIMKSYPVDHQKEVARDTLDLLVPVAQKFGLNFIKSKLEDLCLFYLDFESYNYILNRLNTSPNALNDYLNNMREGISNLLLENNIEGTVKGRVKNIYSIYNKLAGGKKWEDIYDILALRIIVEDISQCYKVAELIHSQYIPLPGRFKDYINFPKENMYQSLHTTIIGEGERYYEVQIRTHEMNKNAETGKAAHSLYKEQTLKKRKFKL